MDYRFVGLVGATCIALASASALVVLRWDLGKGQSAQTTSAQQPFYILLAYSGTRFGGSRGVESEYRHLESSTFRFGVTVPVLYMRTTKGHQSDWLFDPNFDATVQCGNRRLADDSLSDIIANAIARHLPTMFVLNGGIWADSGCDVPEWDVNDYLEQSTQNCQWTQSNQVFADNYLSGLSGSIESPELARSLTYNVFASDVRHYKRRNLSAAARIIAAFAAEYPDLFVGVTLDADTYMNPFFNGEQWFDYNPGTIRQFREWLQGSGVYASPVSSLVTDVGVSRRHNPLTLDDVNRLARQQWTTWEQVDPPRRFPGSPRDALGPADIPYWEDPWYAEWDVFRRHLVALHYDELAQWTSAAGVPADRIFTAQGFAEPFGRNRPFALRIQSTGQNYDSAGMSLEGAKPRVGHLGAIVYGKSARNDIPTENGRSLFWNFASVDSGWGIVEMNTATLNRPEVVPSYEDAYRVFRDAFNFDARFVTVMAWNGSKGSEAGTSGYRPHTAWRETVAEAAMKDFAISYGGVPRGTRLWTFGTSALGSDDGWDVAGGRKTLRLGSMEVAPTEGSLHLKAPPDSFIRVNAYRQLQIQLLDAERVSQVSVYAHPPGSGGRVLLGRRTVPRLAGTKRIDVDIDWPDGSIGTEVVSELQIQMDFADGAESGAVVVDQILLLP